MTSPGTPLAGPNAPCSSTNPPTPPSPRGIVLFDGLCNLCNSSVQWIIPRDPRARLHFASLQSLAAQRLLAQQQPPPHTPLPDSVILIDADGLHTKSAAILGIAGHLGFPWSLASLLRTIPRPLRDWVYDKVAANRLHWFGSRNACMRPTPELSARFLDASESRGTTPP